VDNFVDKARNFPKTPSIYAPFGHLLKNGADLNPFKIKWLLKIPGIKHIAQRILYCCAASVLFCE
jgi:hypothetical protein